MSTARDVRLLVLKEARALLPLWLASATAMILGIGAQGTSLPLLRGPQLTLGLLAFGLGTVALGAFSVGQEYAYGTLPALIAQPLSRRRLLLWKAAVLVPLLAALAILARSTLLWAVDAPLGEIAALTVLVPLLGVCVAPWLTMICRSTIAGAVFTLAIPVALWLVNDLMPSKLRGPGLTVLWMGLPVVSVLSLAAVVRTFLRLESIDRPLEISLPTSLSLWSRTARPRRGGRHHHPIWLLLGKELRLQFVALVPPVLYTTAWAAIVVTGSDARVLGYGFFGLTALYGIMTAVLVGALASAEERALGTLEVQILQPVAIWKQWMVKVSSVLTLTGGFTILLPIVLERMHPLSQQDTVNWYLGSMFFALTACSLYSSSVCVGGLRAVLVSIPLVATGAAVIGVISPVALRIAVDALGIYSRPLPLYSRSDVVWVGWTFQWLPVLLTSALVGLLIWAAATNHRSAEHGLRRLGRQMLWIAPSVLIGAVISGALPPLVLWFLGTH